VKDAGQMVQACALPGFSWVIEWQALVTLVARAEPADDLLKFTWKRAKVLELRPMRQISKMPVSA
jgi:hypothetical protein